MYHHYDSANKYQNYYIMPRTSRRQALKCDDQMFSLKPLRHNSYFNETIMCSFCNQLDPNQTEQKTHKKKQNCSVFPIFNKDKNCGSPAFILPSQKSYFHENKLRLSIDHYKKVELYTDQKTQLLIPKPRSKHSYCSVCRHSYEDYLQHILSTRHKKEINNSLFNKYILQAVKKFQKQVSKQSVNNSQNTLENQIQTLGKPRKRVKRQYQVFHHNGQARFCVQDNEHIMEAPYWPTQHMKCSYQRVPQFNFSFNMNFMHQGPMMNMNLNMMPPYYCMPPQPFQFPPPIPSYFVGHPMQYPLPPPVSLKSNYIVIDDNS